VKGKMLCYPCDLNDEDQVKAVFRHIGDKFDGIDLLCNNANVMKKGFIMDDKNTADMYEIMETNVLSLCVVTREAVKLMRMRAMERKDLGHIVNINSIFGRKVTACTVMKILLGSSSRNSVIVSKYFNLFSFLQPGTKPMNGMYAATK
jgi:NAD(P)-dependent dehydrogenase (short-subunit alcohol dehydrogenase family)